MEGRGGKKLKEGGRERRTYEKESAGSKGRKIM